MVLWAARSILILVCLGVPLAVGAAVGDETALARGDSLAAAGLYPEAAVEAAALLAAVDARGDDGTMVAAEALVLLLRCQLARGGRLDPSAATHAERLLSLARELDGPAGALLAKALLLSGQVAEREGDFTGARAAYTEALAVRATAGLSAEADQLNYLVALANVRTRLGDYDGVAAMYEQALAIAVASAGPRSVEAARVLANYAIYAKRTGDFPAARDLYEQTLAIQAELYGEDNLSVARTHFNLANLLTEMADYDGARAHYGQSLAVRELLLGPDSPEVARTLMGLALVEQDAADLLIARAYAERAVAIQREVLPPLHPQRAAGLSVLAVIQADLGDLDAARATLEEVLAVYEQAYGPMHIAVGEVVAEMGRISQLAGDVQGALAAYGRARDIFAADEGGREKLSGVLHVEARLLAEMGPDPEAVVLARQSLELRREAPGPGNRALARPLATLGFCLWRVGDDTAADSCLVLALQYLGAGGDREHPLFYLAQLDLARVRLALGDTEGALALALAVEQGRRAALRVIIRGLPERLALEHVRQWPSGIEFAAALAAGGALAPPDVARVWDEVVQSRALVLDEMALRYRTAAMSADAATDSLRRALAVVTRDEAGLLVAGWQGEDSDDLRERFGTLRLRREQLERQLGERDPAASGAAPTLATVAAALPADAALVSYLRCDARFDAEATCVAFVLPVGARAPVAVDLGSAASLDLLVRVWRDEAGPGRDVPGRSAASAEVACRRAGEALRVRAWDPLLPYLVGAAPVAIVPDGALHLVNFAALPAGDGLYLIDEPRPLVYLDAERDLVDHPQDRSAPGELLAFGAPEVGAGPAALGFAPLPASEEEVQSIAALWRGARPDAAGDAVLALLGPDASEASFKRLAPRYGAVHLATHGFWLADGVAVGPPGQRGVGGLMVDAGASRTLGGAAGPMLRSGLVLAGDASGEDGILTAAEITVLDLGGTAWVVLSACESGVGATTAGEGVLGLRRAFRLAGARNLVLSLWPLEDQAIRDWMLGLYAAHLTDRLELVPSAWQAAREVLAARRAAGLDTHPHTWAAFIACGE